jgi:hypothetical protein
VGGAALSGLHPSTFVGPGMNEGFRADIWKPFSHRFRLRELLHPKHVVHLERGRRVTLAEAACAFDYGTLLKLARN